MLAFFEQKPDCEHNPILRCRCGTLLISHQAHTTYYDGSINIFNLWVLFLRFFIDMHLIPQLITTKDL